MKKLIQISLVVILVVIALQASMGSPIALSCQASSQASTTISGMANTSGGAQVPLIVYPTGTGICAVPNVGWNS